MYYPEQPAVTSAYGYGGGGGGGGGGNYGNMGIATHPNTGYSNINNVNPYSANPHSTYNDQVYHIQVPGANSSRYGYAQ